MIEVSETERKEVISHCVEFLGKVWNSFKDEEIECQRITSGVANKTYHVWIKDCKPSENNNNVIHSNVIVRIYNSGVLGSENFLKFNGEAAEVVIHQRLFEGGLAAELLGVFNGGRIEEFVPSHPATVDQLKCIELSKEVIRKLAKFHTQSMPISKKPNYVDNVAKVVKGLKITSNYLEKFPNETEECKLIMKFPFEEELPWIQQILPIIGHKIVFSHNDMNPNNILLKENPMNEYDRILIIDYEMNSYFYRAYDLAYFLRMKRARIQIQANKLAFSFDEEEGFETDALLQEYLDESKKLNDCEFNPEYDNLERFRMEVEFFDLVVDFISMGFIKPAIVGTNIPFPLGLTAKFASGFKEKKENLIKKYGDPINW